MNAKRRKEAYEALHPETKHGGDHKSESSRQFGNLKSDDRFTADTATRTGQSERAVQRAMNAKRTKDQRPVGITDKETWLLHRFRLMTPKAQSLFIQFLKAAIAKRGVQKAALALFRANGDPDAKAKAVEAVDRLGAVS